VDLHAYKPFDGRFGIIITRASMTYIVDLNAYELHLGDEIFSTTSLMNARVKHYT
jgi:hypothetical protein